ESIVESKSFSRSRTTAISSETRFRNARTSDSENPRTPFENERFAISSGERCGVLEMSRCRPDSDIGIPPKNPHKRGVGAPPPGDRLTARKNAIRELSGSLGCSRRRRLDGITTVLAQHAQRVVKRRNGDDLHALARAVRRPDKVLLA